MNFKIPIAEATDIKQIEWTDINILLRKLNHNFWCFKFSYVCSWVYVIESSSTTLSNSSSGQIFSKYVLSSSSLLLLTSSFSIVALVLIFVSLLIFEGYVYVDDVFWGTKWNFYFYVCENAYLIWVEHSTSRSTLGGIYTTKYPGFWQRYWKIT